MNKRDNRRRLQVDLALVKKIRLYLWGCSRSCSKAEMAERILIDRVSNADNWSEVIRDLRQEAAINRQTLQEYVVSLLQQDPEFAELPLTDIDWMPLLETQQDAIKAELLTLLEQGKIEEAIILLKQG